MSLIERDHPLFRKTTNHYVPPTWKQMTSQDPSAVLYDNSNNTNPSTPLEEDDVRKKSVSPLHRSIVASPNTEEDAVEDRPRGARVKQRFGVCSILISVGQPVVLTGMMTLCGVAPIDVNPVIGPYPDALSRYGGNNAYLLLHNRHYWRLFTPAFLPSGILHLICNLAHPLQTCAILEREWGTPTFLTIHLLTAVGGNILACITDPHHITVGSSSPIMGLLGAKITQLTLRTFYDPLLSQRQRQQRQQDDSYHHLEEHVRVEQWGTYLRIVVFVSLFGFFPFSSWGGPIGAFFTGASIGIYLFSNDTRYPMIQRGFGISCIINLFFSVVSNMKYMIEPDEGLSDPCDYYQPIHQEGYDCTCLG